MCDTDPEYDPIADLNGDGCIDLSDYATLLGMYGQTIGEDSIWAVYEWDAENRLISVMPGRPPADRTSDDRRLEFKYDYMGRRVEKRVVVWDPNLGTEGDWDESDPNSVVLRYAYHGWLPLLEYEVSDAGEPTESMKILRKYTWGLDLSGTLDGAGGIGGLLACEDTQGTASTADDKSYFYFYDANGNVGQVIDAADGSIAAAYEYDPYGVRINDPAPDEYSQPFRFSTKFWDDETGLGYWGYRYYNPKLGRWISRDPIGEKGGSNLYAYCGNAPSIAIDRYGDDFIAIADRSVRTPLAKPFYHYSVEYWQSCCHDFPVGWGFYRSDLVNGKLRNRCVQIASAELLKDDNWEGINVIGEIINVNISVVHFWGYRYGDPSSSSTRGKVVYYNKDNKIVKAKWNIISDWAAHYPWAEQNGGNHMGWTGPLMRWPMSWYQPLGNNSNTFARDMLRAADIPMIELGGSHPGNISPQGVNQDPVYIGGRIVGRPWHK